MKKKIKVPKCFVCLDQGFVLYRKKVGEYEGEYVAHCTCKAGKAYAYDGKQCEKNKSPYYIPSVAEELDHVGIGAKNFHDWWERNNNKEGIEKAMEQLGMEVPINDKAL